jgi:hypothetical protein
MSTLPPLPKIELPMPLASVGPDRPGGVAGPDRPGVVAGPDRPGGVAHSAEGVLRKTETEELVSERRPMVAMDDAREALVGIPGDLLAGRGSLYDVATRNNRLRGLGIILVLIALCAAVFELFR